jgi:hypothetical protein
MHKDKENYYIRKIKRLESKIKKKVKDNFVEKNLSLFKDILDKDGDVLGHEDLALRYFYTHRRGEKEIPATKVNIFVQDILMAKVMLNEEIAEKDHAVRYSMAVDSLIRHLQKDRVKRPRSTNKASAKAVKESLPGPTEEELEEAKRKAREELIKRNQELSMLNDKLAEQNKPAEEAPKTLPGFDSARMDKTIER